MAEPQFKRRMQVESVTSLLGRLPASIRDRMTPAYVLESAHGIVAGASACPACGRVYQLDDYPSTRCLGERCGRPHDVRCSNPQCVVPGRGMCRPRPYPAKDGFGAGWETPSLECDDCLDRSVLEHRASVLKDWIPSKYMQLSEPDEYKAGWPQRAALARELAAWVRGLSKPSPERHPDWRPIVWAWGSVGAGKTVAVCKAARTVVEQGMFGSFAWLREAELLEAAKTHRERGDQKASKIRLAAGRHMSPKELLDAARGAGLLVIDELLSDGAEPYMGSDGTRLRAADVIGDIVYERADSWRPTLIASNQLWEWRDARGELQQPVATAFGSHTESRVVQAARSAQCTGVDMRRNAAGMQG